MNFSPRSPPGNMISSPIFRLGGKLEIQNWGHRGRFCKGTVEKRLVDLSNGIWSCIWCGLLVLLVPVWCPKVTKRATRTGCSVAKQVRTESRIAKEWHIFLDAWPVWWFKQAKRRSGGFSRLEMALAGWKYASINPFCGSLFINLRHFHPLDVNGWRWLRWVSIDLGISQVSHDIHGCPLSRCCDGI